MWEFSCLTRRMNMQYLSAANSAGREEHVGERSQAEVGETGLVGYVTGTGKPRVALDTGADAVFFNNPDLPRDPLRNCAAPACG